jgi:hypothetical protein
LRSRSTRPDRRPDLKLKPILISVLLKALMMLPAALRPARRHRHPRRRQFRSGSLRRAPPIRRPSSGDLPVSFLAGKHAARSADRDERKAARSDRAPIQSGPVHGRTWRNTPDRSDAVVLHLGSRAAKFSRVLNNYQPERSREPTATFPDA